MFRAGAVTLLCLLTIETASPFSRELNFLGLIFPLSLPTEALQDCGRGVGFEWFAGMNGPFNRRSYRTRNLEAD